MHFLIPAGIFTAELFTKNHREKETGNREYLNGNIRITTYHNHGAFLNSGESKPKVIAVLSTVLSVFLGIFLSSVCGKNGSGRLRLPAALLLGGACSNTYDRLKRGYVVDYLQFPKLPGKMKHVVYNISDFCIFLGGILFCIRSQK